MRQVFFRWGSQYGQARTGLQAVWAVLLLFLVTAMVGGCSDDKGGTGSVQTGSCIDCHTSKDQILATAEPDTSGGTGESGEG